MNYRIISYGDEFLVEFYKNIGWFKKKYKWVTWEDCVDMPVLFATEKDAIVAARKYIRRVV